MIGLCGLFAVGPMLGLMHRTNAKPVPVRVLAATALPADTRQFTSRASRSELRMEFPFDQTVDAAATSTPAPSTTLTTVAPIKPRAAKAPARVVHHPSTTAASPATAAPRPKPTPTTAAPPPAHSETGGASWYRTKAGTCANNEAPMGTVLTVTDLATGGSVTCQVVSRGPFAQGRIIDLAEATFAQLADPSTGVIQVRVTW